jgi:hypothetical protein
MSWPILLVVITVSFILGALWHRAHAADVRRRHRNHIEVPFPLPVQMFDSTTEYYRGRQSAERIER